MKTFSWRSGLMLVATALLVPTAIAAVPSRCAVV